MSPSIPLSEAAIEAILQRTPRLTIGVVGDFFLDRYLDLDGSLTEPSLETGLDAYQVARQFYALAVTLVPAGREAELRDQLNRAALSTLLNLAEGVGRISPRDKARFYATARGSAMEAAALVDVIHLRRLAPSPVCRLARTLLVREVQMLSRLGRVMMGRLK